VEIKCQLDATDVFIADLIACSTKKKPTKNTHTQPPRHSTRPVTNLDNTRHLRLRIQIPQEFTKLFFTFLQHEIPQAATTV